MPRGFPVKVSLDRCETGKPLRVQFRVLRIENIIYARRQLQSFRGPPAESGIEPEMAGDIHFGQRRGEICRSVELHLLRKIQAGPELILIVGTGAAVDGSVSVAFTPG